MRKLILAFTATTILVGTVPLSAFADKQYVVDPVCDEGDTLEVDDRGGIYCEDSSESTENSLLVIGGLIGLVGIIWAIKDKGNPGFAEAAGIDRDNLPRPYVLKLGETIMALGFEYNTWADDVLFLENRLLTGDSIDETRIERIRGGYKIRW